MKKARLKEEQIIAILREHEAGAATADVCRKHGVSQRWACRVIGVDRALVRYRSRRPDDKAGRQRLRELAATHRRFCWRRLRVLMSREGVHMNHKKLRRLYVEAILSSNSMNEALSLTENASELALQTMLGMSGGRPDDGLDLKNLSGDGAAEYLGRRFSSDLER